ERRREEMQVVQPTHVGARHAGALELPLEEGHGAVPDAVELAREPLGLERAHALDRHGLDLGIVVALLARDGPLHPFFLRSSIASAKRGAAAPSGTCASGTSSTSMERSAVAFTRSATRAANAVRSAGSPASPTRSTARS